MNTYNDTPTMENERSKLILTLDGTVINEYFIDKNSVSIGRKLNNDIQLTEPTVSGNHTIIKILNDEAVISDNASTNGTLLNGVKITKSALKHGDIIQIGNYQFSYHDAQDVYEPTLFIKAEVDELQNKILTSPAIDSISIPLAAVRVLDGPLKSTELELSKPFTTIGFDGDKYAIIARNPDGYTISSLNDKKFKQDSDMPTINGKRLGKKFKKLNDRDVIGLLDTKIEFFYY